MRDEIVDLADRSRAMSDFQFIEFWSLTDDEQAEYVAPMKERVAHGEERLEALVENVRILRLLFAWRQGAITALEFVERVRGALLDPTIRPESEER